MECMSDRHNPHFTYVYDKSSYHILFFYIQKTNYTSTVVNSSVDRASSVQIFDI